MATALMPEVFLYHTMTDIRIGIVMTASVLVTSVRLAPGRVSCPYAAGNTTVFMPQGQAYTRQVQRHSISGKWSARSTTKNAPGIRIKRSAAIQ